MAKLTKEKFDVSGKHIKDRTTYVGQVELYLYYDTTYNFFYFEFEELKKYFDEANLSNIKRISFNDCKTRDAAIGIVKALFDNLSKKTRMLRIELGIPGRIYKTKNQNYSEKNHLFENEYIDNENLPKYLLEMLNRNSHLDFGLSLNFQRIMKTESSGYSLYTHCDENWNLNPSYIFDTFSYNLIEWSQETEDFLISMQKQLDALCENVLNFFNAKSIDEFNERILSVNTKNILK